MDAILKAFWEAIFPVLLTLLTAIIGYVGLKAKNFINLKIGKEKEEWLLKAGYKAWDIVEEYFRIFPDEKAGINSKIIMFTKEIRKFVPFITDAQIESIRQAIAGQYNADKPTVIETISNTQTVTVEPITIYKTPDGVELKPISEPICGPGK